MERHIVSYLFQHKKCPLPGIGSLEIHDGSAYISYPDKKVMAPRPAIRLTNNTVMPDALQEYISGMENIPVWAAQNQLTDFCRKLQALDTNAEMPLPDAGVFFKTTDGKLSFHSVSVPAVFLPDVDAEKVIHPDASHEMLVGDRQTTSTQMAAYYNDSADGTKSRWWLWPLLLAIAAVSAIVLYHNSTGHNNNSGNLQKLEANKTDSSYQSR